MQNLLSLKVGPDSTGWGICGTGQRAQEMVLQAIRQQPAAPGNTAGAWAVGVYSHNERRAHAFAESLAIPHSFANLSDLLQRHEVRAVYIASHPRQHYSLTMAALTAGKHVLVETPPALTVAEAQTLQQTAEHRGLLLAVSHPLRTDPAVQRLQRLLADDLIGDVLGCRILNTAALTRQQQTWRLQPNGGGALLHRTYHAVDLLQHLLHDEVTSVFATGSQQVLRETTTGPLGAHTPYGSTPQQIATLRDHAVEEEVHSLLTLRHHAFTAQLHDSFFIPHISSILELYGSRGTLQLEHWADPTTESKLWLMRNGFSQSLDVVPGHPDQRMVTAFQERLHTNFPVYASAEGLSTDSLGTDPSPTDPSPTDPSHIAPPTNVPYQRSPAYRSPALLADAQAGINCLAVITAARQSLWNRHPIMLAHRNLRL